jgi:heme-degrading monooxygenase HmoA
MIPGRKAGGHPNWGPTAKEVAIRDKLGLRVNMPFDAAHHASSPPYAQRLSMLQLRPLDPLVPIARQLGEAQSPVVLINVFTVDAKDADVLLKAWERGANWMRQQPGYISTQLHRGIAGSAVFLNYAVWESVAHFRQAFTHPDFTSALAAYPSSAVAAPHLFEKIAVANLCTA